MSEGSQQGPGGAGGNLRDPTRDPAGQPATIGSSPAPKPADAIAPDASTPAPDATPAGAGTVPAGLRPEILIVLGLSLGQSAVYAVVSLIAKLTQGPLSQATATLNRSVSPRPYLDLTYQLLNIGFALVPVALALYLLGTRANPRPGTRPAALLGLDAARPGRDLLAGIALAALIGIPGLGLYLAGRALGVTATVVPAALAQHWWTVPVLILAALQNALVEEVIVVGYLITRLEQLRWTPLAIIATSATIRGSYHLYQGFGPFVANAIMGVIFAVYYLRVRRVMPLVVAHTALDVVAFVGYALFADALGLPG
ncbi:MAG: CPBP family intramembrane glutamic endopeptidase [Actinomycetales bacterium]